MRVALCGFGSMGRHHAQLLSKHEPPVEFCGIADVRKECRTLAAEEFPGVKVWARAQDMLSEEHFDVVLVCLPTYMHAEISIMAMRQGAHVFCEKPMALNVEQCQEMIKTSKETGRMLLIGQVLRFWPEYVFLKQAIEKQSYGKLRALSMCRVGGVSIGWEGWFLDENRGGTQIFDRHIHDSDAVLWLLGKPRAVQAYGFSRDPFAEGGIVHNFTHYDYGDELVVSAEGSADMPKGFPFTTIYRATFEKACLEYYGRNTPTLTLYEDGKVSHPLQDEKETHIQSGLNISSASPYFNEQEYFFSCIRSNKRPERVTAAAAMQTIALMRAEMESVRSKKPVLL
ncbi:MAG: Gfo/Idh/MocA family oxidoreductase [Oligosphaeraceae bacterium]|nr:Gfo/Idh/MocA family oxidoreductase [Oligosphaeraceae bacterium]